MAQGNKGTDGGQVKVGLHWIWQTPSRGHPIRQRYQGANSQRTQTDYTTLKSHTVTRRDHDQKIGVGGCRVLSMGENRGPTASLPSSDLGMGCAVLEREI